MDKNESEGKVLLTTEPALPAIPQDQMQPAPDVPPVICEQPKKKGLPGGALLLSTGALLLLAIGGGYGCYRMWQAQQEARRLQEMFCMPDLTGMEMEYAVETLKKAGCKVTVQYEPFLLFAHNTVVKTSLLADAWYPLGSEVKVVVCRKPDLKTPSDFRTLSLPDVPVIRDGLVLTNIEVQEKEIFLTLFNLNSQRLKNVTLTMGFPGEEGIGKASDRRYVLEGVCIEPKSSASIRLVPHAYGASRVEFRHASYLKEEIVVDDQ